MAANVWTHYDPMMAAHAAAGRVRAATGDWESGPLSQRVDEFRAALAETCWAMGSLAGAVNYVGEQLEIDLRPQASPDRVEAAGRLYWTYRTLQLCDGGGLSGGIDTSASVPTETGALPAAAIVAIVAVGVVGVGYCAYQASSVIDRQLARRERSRRLMQAHEEAMKIVEAHLERERAAGKQLPLDAASKEVLGALRAQQEAVLAEPEQPYEPFLPRAVSTGTGWAIGTTPLLVAGAVLAYALTR